ncbi:TIGR00266 family protein [Agarilytica rhodophyticola]|uniref:TIGR00266 family protein n=1 Tax=Agarilytica rhodophyticola TaxID=1737490 RepID=UPI000B348233|nr:TIGR00266 family protein [Agarilytica rhodophyticola]
MKSDIKGGQAFSYVDITLDPGDSIVSESDAMSSMDPALDLTASFNGGFIKGLLRKFLGNESLFISRFSNNGNKPCKLVLAPANPGEIKSIELNNEAFNLQPGAFIACTEGVTLGLQWAGFVSWIAREGLFRLHMSGSGKVFYGAYGALLEKDIDGEFIVDTGHLVAYEPGIKLKLQLAGGIFSSFFGGEGLVTRVEGKGKIILQSRSISGLAAWLNPKL